MVTTKTLIFTKKQPIETSSSWYENVDIYENNQLNHRVSHENAGINEKKKNNRKVEWLSQKRLYPPNRCVKQIFHGYIFWFICISMIYIRQAFEVFIHLLISLAGIFLWQRRLDTMDVVSMQKVKN